jgi:hypothetical protein
VSQSITVTWLWRPIGQLKLVDGKLVFPQVPNLPGVYRFTFADGGGVPTGVYVGEADLLPRRFRHYRTPGSRQQTNLRMNPIMIDTLERGGSIGVEIVTQSQVKVGDQLPVPLDLTWKSARVLVERAAEVTARQEDVPIHNR